MEKDIGKELDMKEISVNLVMELVKKYQLRNLENKINSEQQKPHKA